LACRELVAAGAVADEHEPQAGHALTQGGGRVDEVPRALLLDQPADEEHVGPPLGRQRAVHRKALRRDADVLDRHAVVGHALRERRAPDGLRHRHEMHRLVGGHRTQPLGIVAHARAAVAGMPPVGMGVDVVAVQRYHHRQREPLHRGPDLHGIGGEVHVHEVGPQLAQRAQLGRRMPEHALGDAVGAAQRAAEPRVAPQHAQRRAIERGPRVEQGLAEERRVPALQRTHLVADEGLGDGQDGRAVHRHPRRLGVVARIGAR
jgi:hypothetical protein